MKKNLLVSISMAMIILNITALSSRAILLGTTGSGDANSTLIEINPVTGELVRTIGSIGYTVNGMGYDPISKKLYGSTSINDPLYNGLIEINLISGAGTPIGMHQWGLTDYTAVNNIAMNSAGQMFGWWEPTQDDLVSIDKNSGLATRIGEAQINTAEEGLAFDKNDTLFLVNGNGKVYTVDAETGVATYVNSIGTTAHHGGFDFSSGLYFGISTAQTNPKSLIVANLTTGYLIKSIQTVNDLHTLAFVNEEDGNPLDPIPEPKTIISLSFGLIFLAFTYRKRRKKS